jgi:hypothetical protein
MTMNAVLAHITGGDMATMLSIFSLGVAFGAVVALSYVRRPERRARP